MSSFFGIIQDIAEHKITQAIQEGAFDNLPGRGQPLSLEDDSNIPEDMRMAYKILKNSGFTTPEVEQKKEINNILECLEDCSDEQVRYRQIQKLNYLVIKLNESRRVPVNLEEEQIYYQKVVQKVKVRQKTADQEK